MNETLPPLALQVSKILSEKSEERFSAARNDKNLYTLTNKNGIIVQVTNYGGKIVRIFVPNRFGVLNDIVLGYDTIEGYLSGNPYFGAICGRYANRIANGKFTIDGQSYQLPVNNGPNLLHGGSEGFNNQTFKVTSIEKQKVTLIYVSKDGEMGFPGNLTLQVVYTLTDQDELCLDYEATTDKSTFINICSHSFFNLAGEGTG